VTFLSPADAARRLGVSAKALRLYEERGLVTPGRTPAGWRAYSPTDIARAEEIVALRALGFSLAQVARVFSGDASGLEPALAAHQTALEGRLRHLAAAIDRIRSLRSGLASGATPTISDLARLEAQPVIAAFDLPWPWGGERFELRGRRSLTWITGPLGSGKTKLAERLAQELRCPLVGLDRAAMIADAAHQSRVTQSLDWLIEDGAEQSDALTALVSHLESGSALVIDLIEQHLDEPTQLALAAYLRRRGADAPPLFAMTRSTAMLDLAACGPDEAIIFCPASHSPPMIVRPHPGAPGYEAVTTCLAPPDVRARTEGVVAFRPPAA
jgi:DNA-binding transcriptional MerR regulator